MNIFRDAAVSEATRRLLPEAVEKAGTRFGARAANTHLRDQAGLGTCRSTEALVVLGVIASNGSGEQVSEEAELAVNHAE